MNPIYRFFLTKNSGQPKEVFPIYKDDVAIEWALESNEMFYRRKLTGKLTFVGPDYELIMPTPSAYGDTFYLDIEISYDRGGNWAIYWRGVFYQTDCEINFADKKIIVTPSVYDQYTDVIAGLDKEFNLVDLKPVIQPIDLVKRPIIQVYLAGQPKITSFMGGMYWEQDCEATTNYQTLTQTCNFQYLFSAGYIDVLQQGTPTIPSRFVGNIASAGNTELSRGDFKIHSQGLGYVYITRISDNKTLWSAMNVYLDNNEQITLTPVADSGATGDVIIKVHSIAVYMRALTDVLDVGGTQTYPISDNDIVPDHRNYHRVAVLNLPGLIWYTDYTDDEPTQWGLAPNGEYYAQGIPGSAGITAAYPIARSQWDILSFWFLSSSMDDLLESKMRTAIRLRDVYPLYSVISVILNKIAPSITFTNDVSYSQFINGYTDPITGDVRYYFITPKSNVITIDYDEPATNAPITLKTIFNMLRDCFKCYWFVEDGKMRIEHIHFFENGGSYTGAPQIGVDLTEQINTRNNKELAFGQESVTFDKPEMTARYEFGWMDDVTLPFNGEPINVIGGYVNKDKIEKIEVSQFTSDVDYILMNPGEISQDGFVLMAAQVTNNGLELPIMKFEDIGVVLQNALCAFVYLQKYYAYYMPTRHYRIGDIGNSYETAESVKPNKNHNVQFPAITNVDIYKLVKTFIGNGVINKISINLSSRNAKATLKYGSE